MPRQPRYTLAGIPQHIIQRGHNRQSTFFGDNDYRHYMTFLREACVRHHCQLHAYVLMSNHVHLLMTPNEPQAIVKVMQSVGRRYVGYVNDLYHRTGTLWEGRYRASLVDSERYVLGCYRYIEQNPLRAKVVSDLREYPWSSFAHHIGERVDPLVVDHEHYLLLGRSAGERQAAYRNLMHSPFDDALLSVIRETTNQCLVLGDEGFKVKVE
jgi:putative transposase